jgi:hypothetical protein
MPGIARISAGTVVKSELTKSKGNGPYQNISNFGSASVSVFDCPHKKCAQIQTVSGVESPQGECTNVLFGSGKKTFWAVSSVSGASPIDEYKAGKPDKFVASLQGASGDTLVGCAMSTTGDLAATSITNGHVDLFKGAKGTPTVLTTPLIEAFFPGFDNKGNLYVSGFNSGGTFSFVELPKGKTTWITLSTSNSVSGGVVQFDGKYITLNTSRAIYGYTCRGTTCTLKRTVSLFGNCDGSWIANGDVICADAGNNDAAIYKYPAGGSPVAHLTGSFNEPVGAVQVEK